MECKTVKIKSSHPPSQGDFVEINAGDFDASRHELFVGLPPAPAAPVVPPPPPAPPHPLDGLGKDWRERSDLRTLAASVSGRAVENTKQAIQVIEQALKARG